MLRHIWSFVLCGAGILRRAIEPMRLGHEVLGHGFLVMKFSHFTMAFMVIFALPGSVFAGPRYTKEEILNHFSPPSDGRGICIASADQPCGESPGVVKSAIPSFDLAVNFEYNSEKLTSEAKENLSVFASALKDPSLSEQTFNIEGYTDSIGSDEYNLKLSKRRAESVAHFLSQNGVERKRLKVFGFGKSRPVRPEGTDPINRRVEAKLAN